MADQATKELRKRVAKGLAVFVAIIAVVSTALTWWFISARISIVAVRGDSMEPTLQSGQTAVIEQAQEVEKGMLVVFRKPDSWGYMGDESPELIKRIVAGGGSTVAYDGDSLYVDGLLVYNLTDDGYQCSLEPGYTHTLSSLELFVLGDNHKASLDSLRILCDNEPNSNPYVPFLSTLTYGELKGTF